MRRPVAVSILAIAALALVIVIGAAGGADSLPHVGIAYVTGAANSPAQVWLAGPDGRDQRRLGTGAQPLISPDGRMVAASSSGSSGPALRLYVESGSAPRQFFDLSRETAVAQAWSSDARYLAVILSSTNPASVAASGLAVIDTVNGSYRMLARGPIFGASFAPDGTHRVVYGAASTLALAAPVNVILAGVDGSKQIQLTHDGRSLNPIWGHGQIVFDHEALRAGNAPAYQVWLMATDGGHPVELTHVRVPALRYGLVPRGLSADGTRLLAEYEGQDTSQAWTITLANGHAQELRIAGHSVTGAAISRSGATVLADRGGFLNPPDSGAIESVPFSGGDPIPLVARGSEPSWNG